MKLFSKNSALVGLFILGIFAITGTAHADARAEINSHTLKAGDPPPTSTETEEEDEEADMDVDDGDYSGDDSDDTATE